MSDTYNCHLVKDDTIMSSKTASLLGVSYDDIVTILGEPNVADDPYKVRWSWGLRVLPSNSPLAIWDWKGSADRNEWSIFGNCETWSKLFPEATIKS
jgi:hypothetical protein